MRWAERAALHNYQGFCSPAFLPVMPGAACRVRTPIGVLSSSCCYLQTGSVKHAGPQEALPAPPHQGSCAAARQAPACAERGCRGGGARAMLTALGPSFLKAGQVLASRPDIVREDYMNELCTLQDDVPCFPDAEARRRGGPPALHGVAWMRLLTVQAGGC